jgi:heptaprenyl diphosphate synthase
MLLSPAKHQFRRTHVPLAEWDSATGVARAAIDWLTEWVTSVQPEIGRSGPVCPFVEPSIRANSLRFDVVSLDETPSRDAIVALVRQMVAWFHKGPWVNRNRTLHGLVVAIDDLAEEEGKFLDEAQSHVKPELAGIGLMLGQFHKNCADAAARNPDFLVGRSPVPLLAMRHMAFHDVLFLGGDAACFAAYDARFGARHRTSAKLDPVLVAAYQAAQAKWSRP